MYTYGRGEGTEGLKGVRVVQLPNHFQPQQGLSCILNEIPALGNLLGTEWTLVVHSDLAEHTEDRVGRVRTLLARQEAREGWEQLYGRFSETDVFDSSCFLLNGVLAGWLAMNPRNIKTTTASEIRETILYYQMEKTCRNWDNPDEVLFHGSDN